MFIVNIGIWSGNHQIKTAHLPFYYTVPLQSVFMVLEGRNLKGASLWGNEGILFKKRHILGEYSEFSEIY
jgi:hypothetical protein